MKCIKFDKENKYVKDFISLPKKLYTRKNNMEDSNTMKKILLGEHPLSKDFTLSKFVIYKNDEVVGRFIIPEEVSNMAVFLMSNMGRMIVGDTVFITGGVGTLTKDDMVY